MSNNTRSKAILKILTGKTRTANEERRQLRRAGVVYKHGASANINAIIAAENAAVKRQNAENAAKPKMNNNKTVKASGANKPNNNPNKKPNSKQPKKWATVKTSTRVGL